MTAALQLRRLLSNNLRPTTGSSVCSHVACDGDDGGEALSSYPGSRVIVSLTSTENILWASSITPYADSGG
jgi:hypothetical protein